MLHMEQKNYLLEIVKELVKNKGHIRKLAKTLGTSHMNALRKLKKLSKENVLDYKEEGRNKVYFLKKSVEARAYVFMAENYTLVQIINRYPSLRGIFEKIQKNSKVKLAVLFGSYAKGITKPESDIDLFIETKAKSIKKEIEVINTKLSVKIGKYDRSSLLIKEIEKNHVIIKGIERYYEKSKFFE